MCRCRAKENRKGEKRTAGRVIKTVLKIALGAYAVLFAIFYLNLDTKLFYRIMPVLNKYHYDRMDHKDFAETIRGRNDV